MHNALSWAPLVARVLIGALFLQSGILKVLNFADMVAIAQSVGVPMATTAIVLAIVIEILGGLSVLLGWNIKWGALALGVFTLVATYYFHFNFADQMQTILFTKNMGLVAALLYMAHFGAGKFSVGK